MKNYILVLLAVLGLGFSATSVVPETNATTTAAAEPTVAETELENIPEISATTIESIEESANLTYSAPVRSNASNANTVNASADYQVTKISNSVVSNPYSDLYRTGNMLYAHSYGIFNNLPSRTIGSVFSVKEIDGTIKNYRVSDVRIYKKINATTLALCHNGYEDCTGSHMGNIVNAIYRDVVNNVRVNVPHSVALMTCTGSNDSHRLVVFADAI